MSDNRVVQLFCKMPKIPGKTVISRACASTCYDECASSLDFWPRSDLSS